jgi:hypothetical protein
MKNPVSSGAQLARFKTFSGCAIHQGRVHDASIPSPKMEKTTKPEKSAPEKVKNRQNRSKIVEKQKNAARQIRRLTADTPSRVHRPPIEPSLPNPPSRSSRNQARHESITKHAADHPRTDHTTRAANRKWTMHSPCR